MLRRHARISLDPLEIRPAPQFLKNVQWHSALHMPTGSCVSQIVPPEIGNPRSFQSFSPRLRIDLSDRLPIECKDRNSPRMSVFREKSGPGHLRDFSGRQSPPGRLRTPDAILPFDTQLEITICKILWRPMDSSFMCSVEPDFRDIRNIRLPRFMVSTLFFCKFVNVYLY